MFPLKTRSRASFRPSFHNLNFVLFLIGQTVNFVGGWASAIAIWGIAAYHFHARPAEVTLLTACWSLAPVLSAGVMGLVIDHLGPRRSLIIGYLTAAVIAVGMSLANSLGELDVLAFLYGIAMSLFEPASIALVAAVVEPDDLLRANSALGVTRSIGQVVGPLAVSGLLVIGSFHVVFVADAASFVVGAIAVLLLPAPVHVKPSERPISRWTAGLRQFRQVKELWQITSVQVAIALVSSAFLVVEPLYARNTLHRPAAQFALFETIIGVGAIATGVLLTRSPRTADALGSKRTYMAAIGYGIAAAMFCGTSYLPIAYFGAFAWGVCGAGFGVFSATRLQQITPAEMRGTVFSMNNWAQSFANVVGFPTVAIILTAGTLKGAVVGLAAIPIVVALAAITVVTSVKGEL